MRATAPFLRRWYWRVAAVGLVALGIWFAANAQGASGDTEPADSGGTRLTVISKDEPDWKAELEQLLIEIGHPDPQGAVERAASRPNQSSADDNK